MSVLKVVPPNRSKKVAIKASTVQEVIEKASVKLGLTPGVYQVALDEDGTEIDEDDILLDMAKSATLTLMLIPEGQSWQDKNSQILSNPSTIEAQSKSTPQANLTLEQEPLSHSTTNLWQRFPQRLMNNCENEEPIRNDDRRAMVAAIADYMVQDLKDCSRKTAEKIARSIILKYPTSFTDVINGEVLGSGMESLRSQIYTAVQYRKVPQTTSKRHAEYQSDVSDSEATDNSSMSTVSRKQDEYGCVDYQPLMSDNETDSTQEEKRLELLKCNPLLKADDDKVVKLMDATYATQRVAINKKNRTVEKLFTDWPFFTDARILIKHATRLLGKTVQDTWTESLEQKSKTISKYFKSVEIVKAHQKSKAKKSKIDGPENDAVQENYVLNLLRSAKEAGRLTQSDIPQIAALFPLIVHYMKDEQNLLFLVVDADLNQKELLEKVPCLTPVLMIRGKSIFDENAHFDVVLEQSITITTGSFSQGLLITFLLRY